MKSNPLIVFYVMIMLLIFQNRKIRDFVKYSIAVIASFFITSFMILTFKPGVSGIEWFLLNTSILGAGFLICLIFLRDLNRHDTVINSMYKRNLVLRRRLRIRNEALVAELMKINDKLSRTFLNIISALAKILEARDGYTKGHSEHVTGYALKMGEAINLDRRMMEDIKDGGLAHDIGKVGIPDRVLLKPDKLTNSEYGIMKRHVDIGYDILSSIDGMSKTISNISRSHHERVDGRGYPNGLPAEKLPVEVRIMAIADAYDAMTSNRCYRSAMPVEKAISQLVENSGRQFDGELAGIFIELIRQGKI
jgi:HD-GYP domain-containing protein (c-di-GMP phosphodiesterase class II)